MSARNLETIHRKSGYAHRIWSVSEYEILLEDPRTVLVQDSYSFSIGRLVAREAELLMIAVGQEHQGKGLGRRSLNMFEKVLITKGATCCFLEVAKTNISACTLYEEQGFDVISTRKAYYHLDKKNRVDALIMRKTFCLSSIDDAKIFAGQ